jgi:hypothetical protein
LNDQASRGKMVSVRFSRIGGKMVSGSSTGITTKRNDALVFRIGRRQCTRTVAPSVRTAVELGWPISHPMTEADGPSTSIGSGSEPTRDIVLIADAELCAERPSRGGTGDNDVGSRLKNWPGKGSRLGERFLPTHKAHRGPSGPSFRPDISITAPARKTFPIFFTLFLTRNLWKAET